MQLGLKKIGVIVIVIVIERKKNWVFSITFELDLNYLWISLKNKKIIFFNIFCIKIIVKIEKNIESYKNLKFKKNCIDQEKLFYDYFSNYISTTRINLLAGNSKVI